MGSCSCGCGGTCGKRNPVVLRRNPGCGCGVARRNPAESSLSPAMSLIAILAMGAVVVAAYSRLPQS